MRADPQPLVLYFTRADQGESVAEQRFRLVSDFQPQGDQPAAIASLVEGTERTHFQTLLGGDRYRQNVYDGENYRAGAAPDLGACPQQDIGSPAGQEFQEFFPHNAVQYFISYYDYYQPEAYIPQTDTYIEKDATINDEIDQLRHSATSALFERRDVIIVASVSCIYGLGRPKTTAA